MAPEDSVRAQENRIAAGIEAVRRAAGEDAKRSKDRFKTLEQRLRVVGMPPPPPIELFRGRQNALEILADHLSTPGVRMVAIIGRPGMGKTALARKLLQDLEEGRSLAEDTQALDGIAYLSSRTAGISFERVYFDCAQMLGGEADDDLAAYWQQRHSTADKAAMLLSRMRDGNYVVLLDNLEDYLDKEGRVQDDELRQFLDVLRARETADSARLLITSRAKLAVPSETEDYYRGLPLNDGLEPDRCLEMLRQLDSEGTLGLRSAGDQLLRDLVEAVGGAPRALELIASLLEHGLRLDDVRALASAARASGRDPVQALAEANYETLGPEARRVLEALAVYARPVPVVALDFLLQPACPGMNVPELVSHLSRTHTITYETLSILRPDCPTAAVSLHPTDDAVATARLTPEEAARLHLRAAEYYAAVRLPRPWSRIRQVEPHLLEFEHRLKGGDYVGAGAVMDALDYSWTNHHKYLASLMCLGYGEDSIRRRERLIGRLVSRSREVCNRVSLGWVCRRMGQKAKAKKFLIAAARDAESGEDRNARLYALSELGYFLTDNDKEHLAAWAALAAAREVARSAGDIYGEAHALLGLAFTDFQMGENAASLRNASMALRLFRRLSSPLARYRQIDCWVRLGMIYRKTGDYRRAIKTAQEGLRVAEKHGMADWEAELRSGLGFHYRAQGRYQDAAREHESALELFRQQRGMKREEAVQHSYLGNLYTDMGRFDDARKAYDEAERIARAVDLRRELSWILGNAGVLFCRLGEPDRALRFQEEGRKIVEANQHMDSRCVRCTDLAATHLALGQLDRAEEFLLSALQSASQDEHFELGPALPGAYVAAKPLEDKLPHEMQSPGDHQRRGALLARICLARDRTEEALAVVQKAREPHIEHPHRHYLAALNALALMRLSRGAEAGPVLDEALADAHVALEKADGFYLARYGIAFAHAAQAILATGQAREGRLRLSLEAYEDALRACDAPGVVKDAADLLAELAKLDGEGALRPLRRALSAQPVVNGVD